MLSTQFWICWFCFMVDAAPATSNWAFVDGKGETTSNRSEGWALAITREACSKDMANKCYEKKLDKVGIPRFGSPTCDESIVDGKKTWTCAVRCAGVCDPVNEER